MANDDVAPTGDPAPVRRRLWPHAAALASYALLVAALTWPLLPNATSRMSATHGTFHFDTLHTAWMLAHESRALAAPWSVLDARIYHPEPRTLFYSTPSLGLLPYFAPIYLATGNPVLALDLAFLACAALTAWTIHLVVRHLTGNELAATAGGITFLVTPTVLWGFPSCAPYFAVLQYQPLVVYGAAVPASALATSPLFAALIALQCLADPLYVAPAVMLPLLALALRRVARPATRAAGIRLLVQLAVAGLVLVPVFAGYLDVVLRNPGLRAQSVFAGPERSPGTGAAVPPDLLLRGWFIAWWYRFKVPLVALAVAALGGVGILARRQVRDAALRRVCVHGVGWVLAALALPLLHPASPMLRGLVRGGLVGLVALALLAGLGTAECVRRLSTRVGPAPAAALALVFVVALLTLPLHEGRAYGRYPIQPTPPLDSPLVAVLREGGGPVLELPALRPDTDARALYRATAHRRRLVNGYSSYYPAAAKRRMDLINELPATIPLSLLAVQTNLTTIVVHPADLDPAAKAAWEEILSSPERRPNLRLRTTADDALVFDVIRP